VEQENPFRLDYIGKLQQNSRAGVNSVTGTPQGSIKKNDS
jgi:hypothetical protein